MCEGMGDIGSRLFGGGGGEGGFGGGGTAAADPVPTPTPATPPTPGGDPAGGAPTPAPGAVPGAPTDPAAAGAAPPNPAVRTFGTPGGGAPPAENPQHHFANMMQGLLRQLIGPQAGGMPGSGATPIAGNGAFSQFFNGATGGARKFGGGQPGAPGGTPAPAAAGAGGEAPPAPGGGGGLPPVQSQNPFAGLMQLLSGFGAGGAGGGAGVH